VQAEHDERNAEVCSRQKIERGIAVRPNAREQAGSHGKRGSIAKRAHVAPPDKGQPRGRKAEKQRRRSHRVRRPE
jgi:hypothetical protein